MRKHKVGILATLALAAACLVPGTAFATTIDVDVNGAEAVDSHYWTCTGGTWADGAGTVVPGSPDGSVVYDKANLTLTLKGDLTLNGSGSIDLVLDTITDPGFTFTILVDGNVTITKTCETIADSSLICCECDNCGELVITSAGGNGVLEMYSNVTMDPENDGEANFCFIGNSEYGETALTVKGLQRFSAVSKNAGNGIGDMFNSGIVCYGDVTFSNVGQVVLNCGVNSGAGESALATAAYAIETEEAQVSFVNCPDVSISASGAISDTFAVVCSDFTIENSSVDIKAGAMTGEEGEGGSSVGLVVLNALTIKDADSALKAEGYTVAAWTKTLSVPDAMAFYGATDIETAIPTKAVTWTPFTYADVDDMIRPTCSADGGETLPALKVTTGTPSTPIPATGDATPFAAVGMVVVLAGAVLVVARRKAMQR